MSPSVVKSAHTQDPATHRLRRVLSSAAPALILFAATIAVFWKLTLTTQYTWMNNPDIGNQVLPWFMEQANQLRHGGFPLWDMHHWGGQSLIGQDQPGVLYPLNWILWLTAFSRDHMIVLLANWYIVLIRFFGALFGYLLARDLKLGRFASLCSGAAFALTGFMATTDWPQMINGGIWFPLVVLFSLRALNRRRPLFHMAVAGCLSGFSFWSGHHQLPTFAMLSIGFLLLFYVVFRGTPLRTALILGSVFAGFTLLMGAPQLLPSYEYWSLGLRWVGLDYGLPLHKAIPYIVFDQFSMNPATLLGLIIPVGFPAATAFVGLTIFSFALLAAIVNWRSPIVPPFVGLALLGTLFSIGHYTAIHGLIYSLLPMLDKSRNVQFGVFILDFAIAILAGVGIDFFLEHRREAGAQLLRLSQILLGLGALLSLAMIARGIFQGEKMYDQPPFALLAMSAFFLAWLVHAWRAERIPERAVIICVTGLMLFEFGSLVGANYANKEQGWPYVDRLKAQADLAAYLRAQPGLFRIDKNSADVPYNFGDWFGLDEYHGYAGVTTNVFHMSASGNAGALLGVSYYLGQKPLDSDPEPLLRGNSGVNIYRVPNAFPRAWSVHAAESIASEEEASRRLNAPLEELAAKTFVKGPAPALDTCPGKDSISIRQVRTTQFMVTADMACTGMVIVANTNFPGWTASVDGKNAPVYEAYNFLQGVIVGPGRHQVELHYFPRTLWIGVFMAALGIGALLVVRHRDPAL
jgi:hypothetical protein